MTDGKRGFRRTCLIVLLHFFAQTHLLRTNQRHTLRQEYHYFKMDSIFNILWVSFIAFILEGFFRFHCHRGPVTITVKLDGVYSSIMNSKRLTSTTSTLAAA